MDSEVRHRVEALRRPLEVAAADGFAGVRRVQGLGNALRIACDAVLARLGGATDADSAGLAGGLAAWRATLGTWEQLDEYQQAVEVARGMRLIARVPRPAGATIERKIEAERRAAVAAAAATAPAPSRRTAMPSAATPLTKKSAASSPAPTEPTEAKEPTGAKTARAGAAETNGAKAARASAAETTGASASEANGAAKTNRRGGGSETSAEDPLAAPTYALPGIGPALAEKLAERGLETVEDLLWLVPRRYDDVRNAGSLADACKLDDGVRATFAAKVVSSRMVFGRGRRWGEVRLAGIEAHDRTSVVVRWFNVYGGIDKRMPAGSQVTLSGPVRRRNGRVELANPDVLAVEQPQGGTSGAGARIIARYPDIPGVPAARLRQVCATACARVGMQLDDGVPAHVEKASAMPSLGAAIAHLHAPPPDTSDGDLAAMNRGDSRWQRRLAFGELFSLGIAVAQR
ncbi:MAG: hypothetical protein KIT31_40515, partial [Deltaproteobacteria bacterium]|nr:hypothetical protein [Deltaproteobacteria bacterium]